MAPLTAMKRCAEPASSALTACGRAAAENPAKAATSDAAISVLSSTLSSSGQTDHILGHRIELRALSTGGPRLLSAAPRPAPPVPGRARTCLQAAARRPPDGRHLGSSDIW
jgi:hypothetical protein